MNPHCAAQLEANSGFPLWLRHRVALQVPELGVVSSVSGQEGNWHLAGHEQDKS